MFFLDVLTWLAATCRPILGTTAKGFRVAYTLSPPRPVLPHHAPLRALRFPLAVPPTCLAAPASGRIFLRSIS